MNERSDSPRLTPDERYEAVLAGNAAARRNRPSHLVVAAGLVFVAACAALGFTSCQSSLASADLERRSRQRDEIAGLLAQYAAARSSVRPASENVTAPYTGFRSKMEEIARDAGLDAKLPFPKEQSRPDIPGANRVTFEYTITNSTLDPVLDMLTRATEQIPGTHIARLRIAPKRDNWEVTTTLERWERTNPS